MEIFNTKEANKDTKKEDEISNNSSTHLIQRKRQQSFTHRRSLSRRSLESKQQSLEISKFYTKMQMKNDNLVTPVRTNKRLNLQNVKEIKKRQPTPLPGKRMKNAESKSPRTQMEKQIELAQLSRRLDDEKQRRINAERRAQAFEKQLRLKIKRIKQLQQDLQKLKDNKEANTQLLVDDLKSKSFNLSGMQRLKTNFLQIRIEELEKMNNELAKQLNLNKDQLDKMKEQNETIKQENQLFRHQIFTLNQQTQSALLSMKQRQISLLKQKMRFQTSQRQVFLGNLLQQCERQKLNLQNRIRYLELKIAFINRKQNQQLRDVIKKKDKDIATIRKKLSILANQSIRYRKQMQIHRVRQSILTRCESRSLRSESWSLQLSPEHETFE